MHNFYFLFFILLFTACGSDSGSDLNHDSNSSIDICGGMNEQACDVYNKINEIRIQEGKKPLSIHSKCVAAAQDHAIDMVERNFYSHDSPTESFQQRMGRYQLSGGWVGENIHKIQSADNAIRDWMNSEGHRNNILQANYQSSAVGYYQGHWVQCFTSYKGDLFLVD